MDPTARHARGLAQLDRTCQAHTGTCSVWPHHAMNDSPAGDFMGLVHPSVAFPHCMSPVLGNRGLTGADSSLSVALPGAWHVAAFIKAKNIY